MNIYEGTNIFEETVPEDHTIAHKKIVAAIDFGTTFSGWAYCFKHEFDSDPSNICAKNWNNGSNISTKTPTTVLIEPDGKTFAAFGYEAEDKYAALCAEQNHRDNYYFSKFKMLLHNKQDIRKGTLLDDEFGKQLPAKDVFKHAIKFLHDDLLKECSKGILGTITDTDVLWVLTVPAIWNEMAKRFMKLAAEEAGIPPDCLRIALEPEAASLFCKMMALEKKTTGDLAMSTFEPGSKYIVLDAGGGTVDVSVHEVLGDRNLRELYKASGGAWGGTTVDKAYENVLVKIFGQNIFNKFKKENRDDYIAIFRKFEVRKRATSTTTERDTIISLPATLVETYVEEIGFSLRVAVQNSTVSHFVTPERGNKLRIKAAFMRKLFSVATCNIVTHISELLCFDVVKGAKTIIMVGGLSESSILHETMKLEFPTLNVVVPPDADLSVLKGAVVFGFQPTAITERISRYTYGLEVALPFEDDVHPADKRWHDGKGVPLCCGCFSKIIGCGRQMKLREQIRCETMLRPTSTTGMGFSVYGSTEHDPKYVTDDYCFFVGSFEIVFPDDQNPENLNRKFRVSLGLGDTELRVVARDVHTKELYRAKVKLKDI